MCCIFCHFYFYRANSNLVLILHPYFKNLMFSDIDLITTIGLAAAFCTTVSFLPQVIKILQTNDTRSISLGMYAIFTTGVVLWLVYGFATSNLPVIAANALTVLLAGAVLVMKLRDSYFKK